MTTEQLRAIRDASRPRTRDALINRIRRRLPDGQCLHVARKTYVSTRFVLTDSTDKVIRLIPDARALVEFAITLGAI